MSQQMLYDWFSGPVMTEMVQSEQIAPGLPKPFPAALYNPSPTECVGVNVMWESIIGVRQTALVTDYLSPARVMETQPRTRNFAVALGSRISTPLDGELIIGLMNNVPLWQQRAKTILMQKMRDFRQYTDNLQITMIHSAISQDGIYVDRNGNILPAPTGAVPGTPGSPGFKYNSLYAGTNALQKTSYWPGLPALSENLVGDWSNGSFNIPASVRAMQQGYQFTANYQPVHVIYGKSIPSYFYQNTSLQTYLSRQPVLNEKFMMTNEIPAGMLDLQWHPGYKAYYQDQNNVTQSWVADNQIIILPEITPNWYENLICSLPCPTSLVNPAADISAFLAACPPVRGYSSYVIPCWNPIKLDVIAQGYSWPTLKSPYASWSCLVS